MRQIIINEDTRYLLIGYESENNVTQVVFPYDESWLSCGDGEFKIRVLRNCDTNAYNATNVIDDREAKTLTMTITDIELSVEGPGEFQICYICGNTIKKSKIYRYIVNRAIDSEIVDPPQGSIINEVIQSLAELRTDYNNLSSQVEDVESSVGDLSELETENTDNLVSAINEVRENSGTQIDVDSELSSVSENPVQNKVITNALNSKADGSAVYTKTQVDTALDSKANTADVNTALNGKANSSDVYTKTQIDTALNGKAGTAVATSSANGLMSAQDKTTLDAVAEDYSCALVALGVIDNG